MLTPGRPNFIQLISRALGFSRSPSAKAVEEPQGTQRPRMPATASIQPRNFDLEISEVVVRDSRIGKQLVEMHDYCPEVGTSLAILRDDVLGSENGDSLGLTISDTLEDDKTPVDEQTKAICLAALNRPGLIDIVTMGQILDRTLCYGDAFLSLGIDRDSSKQLYVSRSLMLPTWTMFRLETDDGRLLGYEQRIKLTGEPLYFFEVPHIVHFQHQRQSLYGQSIWRQSAEDWWWLKGGSVDLGAAVREVGVNPNVHEMPEGTDNGYLDAYRNDHESRLEDGVVTNYYTLPGGKIGKIANYNPNLSALTDNMMLRRSRLIMPTQIPDWRFAGFNTKGATDIAGQPAKAYARHINALRSMVLSPGIKQILDTELILRLGVEAFKERGKYQLAYPTILTDPMAVSAQAAPDEAIDPSSEPNPTNGAAKNGTTKGQQPKATVSRRKPARH